MGKKPLTSKVNKIKASDNLRVRYVLSTMKTEESSLDWASTFSFNEVVILFLSLGILENRLGEKVASNLG